MPAIVLEKLTRTFGGIKAVDAIDLSVEPGEFLTLLGPSGCGKTTTLRMVAGLEQNTGGVISIGGEVVSDPSRNYFVPPERRRLGMVFQSYAIWPHMTVFDNVAYPLRIRKKSKEEIADRVGRALALVEMTPYADRPAPALSGGQQQRVAIARALVFEPQVLLLDEPLSNLDARLRTTMGDEFRALQKRLGITTLYVTHDQGEAMALSDRVVVMQSGHILQVGSPEDVYRKPASASVAQFFGSPNLLEADVRGCASEGREFMLDVAGQGWSGHARSAAPVEPGQKTRIMVRPENMRLVNGDAQGHDMMWNGEIVQSIFRGTHRSIVVDTGADKIGLDVNVVDDLPVGHKVKVSADRLAAWAINT